MKEISVHPAVLLAWSLANQEASLAGSLTIEPAHFLLAIMKMLDDAFMDFALQMGLDRDTIQEVNAGIQECRAHINLSGEEITRTRRSLRKAITQSQGAYATHMLHRSDASRQIFRSAVEAVSMEGGDQLRLIHILFPLLQHPPKEATFLTGATLEEAPVSTSEPGSQTELPGAHFRQMATRGPLSELGRDLTEAARQGKLAPVVGRQAESLQVARYLMRTSKRNVLLIGPAGVGKTAIVEGLAQKLVQENAPEYLRSIRIVQVSLADIVAGTKYRGEMEERLQKLVEAASQDENLVLFFDEIHLAMKTGGDSSMDIANILKPALTQNTFRCIGATTTAEYERYIRDDTAFSRRFQTVSVNEPSLDEALIICEAWAGRIEQLQQVKFEPEAVREAVILSSQYIPERCLPDKAIDLLENAASYVKVTSLSFRSTPPSKEPLVINAALIKSVLEEQYGISIQRESLLNLDYIAARLKEKIAGQSHAIASVLQSLAAVQTYPEKQARPMGIMLFIGPTGVGKTYLSECLCEAIFGDQVHHLLRINMNEFKEHYDLSMLLGAPPGLIGHDRPGLLSQFTAQYPRGVILLDEMEKAHPDVHDFFLQIFDKAEMTDARGRKLDFRQYLFIMTCNLAGDQTGVMGFAPAAPDKPGPRRQAAGMLAQHFRPEFLARIDQIVEFTALEKADLKTIFERQLKALVDQIAAQYQVKFSVPEAALEPLCDEFGKGKDGARGFIRSFRQQIATPALRAASQTPSQGLLELVYENGALSFHTGIAEPE